MILNLFTNEKILQMKNQNPRSAPKPGRTKMYFSSPGSVVKSANLPIKFVNSWGSTALPGPESVPHHLPFLWKVKACHLIPQNPSPPNGHHPSFSSKRFKVKLSPIRSNGSSAGDGEVVKRRPKKQGRSTSLGVFHSPEKTRKNGFPHLEIPAIL